MGNYGKLWEYSNIQLKTTLVLFWQAVWGKIRLD
jgi:hypothetical protein